MRNSKFFTRHALATVAVGIAISSFSAFSSFADEVIPKRVLEKEAAQKVAASAPAKTPALPLASIADGNSMRIVAVEWKIKKGREQEFLDYWSTRATVANRGGLIAEFLSGVDSKEKWPWINWTGPIDKPGITTYYNIGLWKDGDSFQDQIGKFVDNNRPPLDFEAERRTRVFLAPQRWRAGQTNLPSKDSDGTK